jgi:predicted Holliday junction resolvase-like endonuclease
LPGSIPKEIQQILGQLSSDDKIMGECPECGEKSPLPNWNLFYKDVYTAAVKDAIDVALSRPAEAKISHDKLKAKLTTLAAKRSVEVNFGKIMEEIAPGLSTFPYHGPDCRSLLDPIDYVVFDGLAKDGEVTSIHFLDIKTGASSLNDHQKQVKDAIEKKRVEFTLY